MHLLHHVCSILLDGVEAVRDTFNRNTTECVQFSHLTLHHSMYIQLSGGARETEKLRPITAVVDGDGARKDILLLQVDETLEDFDPPATIKENKQFSKMTTNGLVH
jgi:hypothetical protein